MPFTAALKNPFREYAGGIYDEVRKTERQSGNVERIAKMGESENGTIV